jgi:ferrous iron transport protein B
MTGVARGSPFQIDYGDVVEGELKRLSETVSRWPNISSTFEPRWLALKLLEGDLDIIDRVRRLEGCEDVLRAHEEAVERLSPHAPHGIDIFIADRRYAYISQVMEDALRRPSEPTITLSERIDRVVTHRLLGVPIFLTVMYLVFNVVVHVSTPYLDWVDGVIGGPITRWAASVLAWSGAPTWLRGLILDGVITGVGGVMVFIPGLIVLFLFIGLLEDSGYMARVAVVMDRFMSFLGLRGKSFVPMVLGFGCAVPAIYATRTLENRRDRLLTAMLIPLMSCSARLPVYVVFGLAIFGQSANLVIWALYFLGVFVAAIIGRIFARTIFRKEADSLFVIELPSYSMPTLKNLWIQVSQRTGRFIRHAGTVILLASVVIWMLLNLPFGGTSLQSSWFGKLSAVLTPVFEPAGFGNWETTGALVTGLVAKEVVVSTMSLIYVGEEAASEIPQAVRIGDDLTEIGGGFIKATIEAGKELIEVLTPGVTVFGATEDANQGTSLSSAVKQVFSPLEAFAFLVFVLLYVPCVATLGTIGGEFGWKWAVFAAIWQTGIAWALAVLVFQGGMILGFA